MKAAKKATRGPGRPARLSRESILEAGLALLRRAPEEPLTVARIAAKVDAVPAALYRHFESLDELLDGVLGAGARRGELEIRPHAPWPEQIRDWMTSLRDHLLRYPAVLPLIGRRGRTSPAWPTPPRCRSRSWSARASPERSSRARTSGSSSNEWAW